MLADGSDCGPQEWPTDDEMESVRESEFQSWKSSQRPPSLTCMWVGIPFEPFLKKGHSLCLETSHGDPLSLKAANSISSC